MTDIEALKEALVEHAKVFANCGDSPREKEAKLWYLTGIVNGFLVGRNDLLSYEELVEILDFKDKLINL